MLFAHHLVVIRGGGDIGTGVAWRLHRCGFPVVVLELAEPLTIRRQVALSSAVHEEQVSIEGMVGRRVSSLDDAAAVAATGLVPVVVDSTLSNCGHSVVIDARLAKRNLDTALDDAPLVIGLGPGFTAGLDCHAVVETARGHRLGRVMWTGGALPNTGEPGEIGGRGGDRVLRAPVDGVVRWYVAIGDAVTAGQVVGQIGGVGITASFDGRVRGLINDSVTVQVGLKIGDIDPRLDTRCDEISDKALAVGGGVLEAVLTWISAQS